MVQNYFCSISWSAQLQAMPLQGVYICSKWEEENVYNELYVDDMQIAAKSENDIQVIHHEDSKLFNLKDLGAARLILGMELSYVPRDKISVLSQQTCATKRVGKFNQNGSAHAYNPSVVRKKLTKYTSKNLDIEKAPTDLWLHQCYM